MPNIIEQQDILKGLTDARLATLMQNPVGDIPPFLVAAEAQRRQAIRQQFSGAGSNESVVDTLTKQMANVPQNIQAPMQTPPQNPPPEQAGIGAIPQQMAHGGPVRRFGVGSLVIPGYKRVQEIADQFNVTVDEAATMLKNNPSLGGTNAATPGLPFSITETNREPRATPSIPAIPVITASPQEVADIEREKMREAKYQEMDNPPGYGTSTPVPAQPNDIYAAAKAPGLYGGRTTKPRDPNASNQDSSITNKEAAAKDSFRKRLEELYRTEEPSNWEEAQKWFAMSQQIMNPDANLMQGLVNAGSVYAQAEAEQASAQREDERALAEMLLKYDIGERDYERSQASAARTEKLKAMEYQSDRAYKQAELARKAADDAQAALNRQMSVLASSGLMSDQIATDPTIVALQKEVSDANKRMNDALIAYQGFNKMLGGAYGLPSRFEVSDGDTIYTTGG